MNFRDVYIQKLTKDLQARGADVREIEEKKLCGIPFMIIKRDDGTEDPVEVYGKSEKEAAQLVSERALQEYTRIANVKELKWMEEVKTGSSI